MNQVGHEIERNVTSRIALDPADWAFATWRPRHPSAAPKPPKFDRHDRLTRVRRLLAGQAMYAIIDPNRVWVNANIEEAKVARVRVGQPVEVHVDATGQTVNGRVMSIAPASAATFSLLPQNNASGNFTKVTQYVPVKIAVETGDAVLPLGTSVAVKIRVASEQSIFPWQ